MQLPLNPALLLGIGVLAVVVFLVLAFFVFPQRFVRDLPELGPPPVGDRISLKDQFTIWAELETRRNDLRTGLLQAIAGLAIIATLLSTLLQLQANQKQATDEQALIRQGQIADRFAHAIDALAGQNSVDIRLGGIYGLEQIARDAGDNRTRLATYEVLTAYVRNHAAWKSDAPLTGDDRYSLSLQARAPDIQAVVTVLGRRERFNGDPRLDFSDVDLRIANVHGHFEGALFGGAHLEGANLYGTHLEGAVFAQAHLENAFLPGAHLERTILTGAHLEGAALVVRGAPPASLRGALFDSGTRWPAGFDWKAAGVQQLHGP